MLRDHGQAQEVLSRCRRLQRKTRCDAGRVPKCEAEPFAGMDRNCVSSLPKLPRGFPSRRRDIILPFEPDWSRAVYHLYVVRVHDRERMQADLAEQGVGTGIHYPVPLYQQNAYAHLGYRTGDFPVTEKVAPEIVSLPMFPQLTLVQIEQVAAALNVITSESVVRRQVVLLLKPAHRNQLSDFRNSR